jgi:hypothetical protein
LAKQTNCFIASILINELIMGLLCAKKYFQLLNTLLSDETRLKKKNCAQVEGKHTIKSVLSYESSIAGHFLSLKRASIQASKQTSSFKNY